MSVSRDHTPVSEKTSGFCKQKARCLKGPAAAGAGLQRQKARGNWEGSRQRSLLEPLQGGFGWGVSSFRTHKPRSFMKVCSGLNKAFVNAAS